MICGGHRLYCCLRNVSTGQYISFSSRAHHAPVFCFSSSVVKRYSYSFARIKRGGESGNGFVLSNPMTGRDPCNKRARKFTNQGSPSTSPKAANQICQSNRGW